MIADCHIHLWQTDNPEELSEDIVRAMDESGVDKVCLFAPPPYPEGKLFLQDGEPSSEIQKGSTELVAEVASFAPDRIIPFSWISPLLGEDSIDEVERAARDYGIKGVKMDPNHWYPHDESIFPLYEKIEDEGLPIIFHSGINWGYVDASRFCRPVFYESLVRFPDLKFALAHVSWPWVDECIATAGKFKFASSGMSFEEYLENEYDPSAVDPEDIQMYIDLTPGTPPIYREEALEKAVRYLGDDLLLYGSDTTTSTIDHLGEVLESDKNLYTQKLRWSQERQDKVLGENLKNFLSI